ncbi:GNAT family N-acetyltransferase [Qipengyuania huizhouensis]|uniref:GNAT family N-acetyltransferase n=1 Tax=Qipengyuania huizhouensis TaxID=2867245 RepID=UPI0018365AD7|nr:GNAT family N-acetyltransferase [Qipengyuania huizhouensis]MBA4765600.1 GNAT family N-acetyltransferase [Erythrobacter sp.]MBX7461610.1 GNAT family N-acetyltransferase [Qipengyuania huizhouensis]
MNEFSIRLARPDDADAFHRVEEDAASLLREEPSLEGIPVPPSKSAEHYRGVIARGNCLAATIEGQVVGFAAAGRVGRELHLHELSVAREQQGRGIGGTLLRALIIDARNCGLSAITLDTYRDIPWNGPFYARHGFVEIENLEDRPHLLRSLEAAADAGLPRERRCAMVKFLD